MVPSRNFTVFPAAATALLAAAPWAQASDRPANIAPAERSDVAHSPVKSRRFSNRLFMSLASCPFLHRMYHRRPNVTGRDDDLRREVLNSLLPRLVNEIGDKKCVAKEMPTRPSGGDRVRFRALWMARCCSILILDQGFHFEARHAADNLR